MSKKNKKQTTKNDHRTPESDALAQKFTESSDYRDNMQWSVYRTLGAIMFPELVAEDDALKAAREESDDPEEIAGMKARQKEIKDTVRSAIYEAYPNLKSHIEAQETKTRGVSLGRSKKTPSTPAEWAEFAVNRAKRLEAEKRDLLGDISSELAEAEKAVALAEKNGERNEARRAKLDERIAGLQETIEKLKFERAALDSQATLTEAQEALAKVQAKAEKKMTTKAGQALLEKLNRANTEIGVVAAAAAKGKIVVYDAETDAFSFGK